jgi:hypothetical protein
MSYEQVGACPICNAPFFLPPQSEWNGPPPQVSYTCTCHELRTFGITHGMPIPTPVPPQP